MPGRWDRKRPNLTAALWSGEVRSRRGHAFPSVSVTRHQFESSPLSRTTARRMSSSATTFPARFAELVYLLAHQPDATLEHERVLGEAITAIAEADASL